MNRGGDDGQMVLPLPAFNAHAARARFDDGSYPAGFWQWLGDNWHIYAAVVELAQDARRRGVPRWSAQGIIEILRWQTALREAGGTPLKINNTAAPGLARLAMAQYPELGGFFELRHRHESRRNAIRLDGTPYHA
jgi:hypothetical protein